MTEPRRLGEYEILTELATGGVATVFVARHVGDAGFERLVAIKRVHRHLLRDPDVFASLADEARISALVRHPNVVATHEVIDQKGELCLVQEYVEGISLAMLHKRALRRGGDGRLPVDAVARIAVDFLRGLHAAHEAVDLRGAPLELVHRDVSPQNVLVGIDGVARLIDFGIARAEGRITETRGGIVKGKLAYMAPEQVGEHDVDRRADLFAAGVVIYELLVGARPFDGASDAECMARILAADVDLDRVASRSSELAPVIDRCLAKEPDARWPDAESLAEAIAAAHRPAGDAAMRALVKDLAGDVLEERRASIREELGRSEEEALLPRPDASEAPAVATPSRPRRAPVAAVLAGVGAVAAVVVLASTWGGGPAASVAPSAPAAPSSTAPAPSAVVSTAEPASPPRTASAAASTTLPSPSLSAPAPSGPRIASPARPAPSSAPSAVPSARRDLQANPYGH